MVARCAHIDYPSLLRSLTCPAFSLSTLLLLPSPRPYTRPVVGRVPSEAGHIYSSRRTGRTRVIGVQRAQSPADVVCKGVLALARFLPGGGHGAARLLKPSMTHFPIHPLGDACLPACDSTEYKRARLKADAYVPLAPARPHARAIPMFILRLRRLGAPS